MKIESIIVKDNGHSCEYDIRIASKLFHIFFRSKEVELIPNPESMTILSILPALVTGSKIEIDAKLSSKFVSSLPTVQTIYTQWFVQQKLKPFPVNHLACRDDETKKSERVGAFFSGGVDAYYTLLKNMDIITDIIFIRGYDVKLEKKGMLDEGSELVKRVGKEFNKNVIEIETNARPFLDKFITYGKSHGALLASVAHLLTNQIGTVLIPSAETYANLIPDGTHPLLDPLWNSDKIEFIHDGNEASRLQKLKKITTSQFVLDNLRVCFGKSESKLNCCKCEKCLRTMISLKLLGVLEKSNSFQNDIDLKAIRKIDITPSRKIYHSELLWELDKHPQFNDISYEISSLLFKPHLIKNNYILIKNYLRKLKYRLPKLYSMFSEHIKS